jgi:hypothetical protein
VRPVSSWGGKPFAEDDGELCVSLNHSRGGPFHSSVALLRTRYSSLSAASSFGKPPGSDSTGAWSSTARSLWSCTGPVLGKYLVRITPGQQRSNSSFSIEM